MPVLLSPSKLTQLRAYAATMLPDDCIIKRNTKTQDNMGTWSDTWGNIATVKCAAIGPQAGQEVTIDSRVGVVAIWTVLLPWGQDVKEGDQLVISSHTLTCQADLTPQSYAVVAAIRCSEVK
jgi:hypothetical protein